MGKQFKLAAVSAALMSIPAVAGVGVSEKRDTEQESEVLAALRASLDEFTKKIDTRFTEMDAKYDERQKGNLTEERFNELTKEFEEGDVKDVMERQDSIEKQVNRLLAGNISSQDANEFGWRDIGERLNKADGFKEFAESGGKRGSAQAEIRDITNAAINASPAGGVLNPNMTIPGIIRDPDRPLTLRDIIPTIATSAQKIDWVREDVFTNNADYQLAEGDAKPESDITYTADETSVVTLAHWIRASKQVLSDIPMLQGEITNRLIVGLNIKEEDEIMAGAGGPGQLSGIVNQATPYDTALDALLPAVGSTVIDKIRRAKYQVRQSFYAADAVILSPLDMVKLDLLKDTDQRYLFTSPFTGGVPRIWGMRSIESDAMADGNFMVGAFALAATIYDRMTTTVLVSDEDRDNFIRNMVTILAEKRLALVVRRPKAFVYGAV